MLEPGGVFFATFNENAARAAHPDPRIPSSTLQDYFDFIEYDFDMLKRLSAAAGLEATYIGNRQHPRNQKMIQFTRDESPGAPKS